jgi:hypothetical protein
MRCFASPVPLSGEFTGNLFDWLVAVLRNPFQQFEGSHIVNVKAMCPLWVVFAHLPMSAVRSDCSRRLRGSIESEEKNGMWIITYIAGLLIASGAMTAYTVHAAKCGSGRHIGFPWTWRRLTFVPLTADLGFTAMVLVSAILVGLPLRASPHNAGVGTVLYLVAILFP